jgi:ABC-type dipeptide/oligopeptide/nickel transport system permease component
MTFINFLLWVVLIFISILIILSAFCLLMIIGSIMGVFSARISGKIIDNINRRFRND